MEISKQERLQLILKAIEGMSSSEWGYIASMISHVYTTKAAKVVLDSSDVKCVLKNIQRELI